MAPTDTTFKTKTSVTNVLLVDIDREMPADAVAKFEQTTLQFIRDTQTNTPGFTVDILAVTVLTQDVVYPPAPDAEEGENRRLVLSPTGLQVAFRTVGVVTEGTAPRDLEFNTVTDAGFEYYFGEYLFRLTQSNDFFEPLGPYVDTTSMIPLPSKTDDESGTDNSKAKFAAAVFFASVALILALIATYFAVQKHLRRSTGKLQVLEHNFHATRTMSEEQQDGEITFGKQEKIDGTLQLNTDGENIELEDVGLTPVSQQGGFSGYNLEKINSPDNDEGSRSSFGFGFQIKKWLTPRQNNDRRRSMDAESSIGFENSGLTTINGGARLSIGGGRKSIEPDAAKASTKNARGILSDQLSFQSENKFNENTPVGIPVSFFGKNDDSDCNESLAGSTASSFFAKMGRTSKIFTGRKSNGHSETGFAVASDSSKVYKFGANSGRGPRKDPDEEVDGDVFQLNEENLAMLHTNSKDGNVEASIAGSNFDEIRSKFETASRTQSQASSAVSSAVLSKYSKQSMRDVLKQKEQQRPPLPRPSDKFEADSVYSEQSELDLNDFGVETTLGARAPRYGDDVSSKNKSSSNGNDYGNSIAQEAPSSVGGSRNHVVTYNPMSQYGSQKSEGGSQRPRALVEQEEKRRMSLNKAIEQGDTYDVFAPAGPIGIVVDTSPLGPAVHSLKSTSPMLGLINAGDLIIALDDEDTRNMTAASLTRLMAKKSRQKERKITLLAPDGF